MIKITEKQFEVQVKELAQLKGWLYYHTWRSFHSPKGFPDCVMVRIRDRRLIFAELKAEGKKLTLEQLDWINSLDIVDNVETYLWHPSDWDSIVEILS